MFGTNSSSSPFGQQASQSGFGGHHQQQQQQPYPQPQGQQSVFAPQHQQPPQQGAYSSTPQQQQQQQQQQGYPFGPGGSQQQTPQQQQPWASQSQQGGSSSMSQGWNPSMQNNGGYDSYQQQQAMMSSQHQQQQYGQPHQQQQQPYQQPMQQVYLPGYLSKIRGQRPYSAAANRKTSGEPSPPKQDDAALNPGSANAGSGSFSTPNTRSSREGNRRGSLDGGPSSPLQGFTSSFFSSPSSDYPSHQGRSTFDGSNSIFGAGGLRGGAGRKSVGLGASRDSASTVGTPGGRERSSSYMRASSIGSPQAHAVDDDDAPPFEALADVDASRGEFGAASFGAASFGDSVNAMATSPPSRQQQGGSAAGNGGFGTPSSYNGRNGAGFRRQQDAAPQASLQSSTGRDSSLCTLLLYGFPSSLSHTVLSHFGSIGEITSHTSLAPASDSSSSDGLVVSECLRIVYAEPWHALRALRRSGELVAGVAYVGVRWADDMLHQEMLMNGINSNAFLSAGGSTIAHSTSPPAGAAVVAKPSNNGGGPNAASASSGAGTGAGARTARDSTPSFGRPITMVDSPAAALRARTAQAAAGSGASSPFSKAMGLFGGGGGGGPASGGANSANTSGFGTPSRSGVAGTGSGPGTPGNQSGVMGRIGDAIFGW